MTVIKAVEFEISIQPDFFTLRGYCSCVREGIDWDGGTDGYLLESVLAI